MRARPGAASPVRVGRASGLGAQDHAAPARPRARRGPWKATNRGCSGGARAPFSRAKAMAPASMTPTATAERARWCRTRASVTWGVLCCGSMARPVDHHFCVHEAEVSTRSLSPVNGSCQHLCGGRLQYGAAARRAFTRGRKNKACRHGWSGGTCRMPEPWPGCQPCASSTAVSRASVAGSHAT